jgi:GGDEF domain-containing protein
LNRWTRKRNPEERTSAAAPGPGVVDERAGVATTERALAHREDRALVLIELDGAEGSATAQGALATAAETRIARTIRPDDLLGRLDDGRFAVLTEQDGAARVAIRLGERLREPFDVGGERLRLIPQIGVGYSDREVATAAAILREAESSPRY